jgi:hypothetical protein
VTRRDDAAPVERRAIHVTMIERRWAVIRFGDRDPLSRHDRKLDAIVEAGRIAAQDGVEIVIFDLGGRPIPPDASDFGT